MIANKGENNLGKGIPQLLDIEIISIYTICCARLAGMDMHEKCGLRFLFQVSPFPALVLRGVIVV